MPLDASFKARLREALHGGHGRDPEPALRHEDAPAQGESRTELRYETEEERQHRVDTEQAAWIADALGGWWQRDDRGGVCLVVDRTYPADRPHGHTEVGRYAEALSRYRQALREFDRRRAPASEQTLFGPPSDIRSPSPSASAGQGRPDDEDRFLFFDLETTGLSGGAGTCAFLVGYGWFEGDSFRTRQYFLSGYGHEAALLRMAAERVDSVVLTTFNGKTFDVPLIGGRYLFHRLASPFDGIAHVDLLHAARRLWRHRPAPDSTSPLRRDDAFGRYFRMTAPLRARGRRFDLSATGASCALGALEEAVLGFQRTNDVPGGEIPGRYFHYVRTGDVRPLEPVLEHNRLDLLSLAAVAGGVARMLEEGPEAARNAHECLALGRLFERSGEGTRATACYERAAEPEAGAVWQADPIIQREALRRLASRHRRDRRYEEAAAAWQQLLDLGGDRGGLEFEALHALAVHHEHRSKDLTVARAIVLRALAATPDRREQEALRHRLARIERKLGTRRLPTSPDD